MSRSDTHITLWENTFIELQDCVQYHRSIAYKTAHSTVIIIVNGKGTVAINQQYYEVSTPVIFHTGADVEVAITLNEAANFYCINYDGHIHYTKPYLQYLHQQFNPLRAQFQHLLHYGLQATEQAENIYKHWQQGLPEHRLLAKTQFYNLMSEVLVAIKANAPQPVPPALAEQVANDITTQYNQKISVQQLASKYGLSERHLLKIFRARYGESIQSYWQKYRLQKALNYIKYSHYPFKEIAKLTGYGDEYYFSRVIKNKTQQSPSRIRLKSASKRTENSIVNDNHFQYSVYEPLFGTQIREGEGGRPMFTYTKKKIAVPFLVSVIALLGACGNSEPAKEEKPAETTEASDNTATTRTVTDDEGRVVEIPAHPEKIVTDWYAGQLLALGVKPIMGNIAYGKFLEEHYEEGEIEDIGNVAASLERIVELQPDLIVTWDIDKVANYEKIAPTIVFGQSKYKTPEEEILAMGKFIDREKEAEAFNADLDKRVTAAREEILKNVPEGSTFSLMRISPKTVTVIASSIDGGRALYKLLDLPPAPKVDELFNSDKDEDGRYRISFETMQDFMGDYTFIIGLDDMKESELPATWKNIPAVKENRVMALESEYYFAPDPLSSLHQVEDMAEKVMELKK